MLFKALNNREKDKAERSYIYSHTTKHLKFTVKSKRSQSALEYMMTYGWAILIIVIVAVILYSMGIFNPSSSVTFTSSGFSPFTISSVICSQDGLSFSILAGPVPNGAYSMSISSFYMISSTGTNTSRISYTLQNPITLKSGQTGVIAIPNVICPSSGTKVSISGTVQYSYSTLAGNVVTNATGTLAGTATHGPTLPGGIEYYSQITISNSQSSATPNPFQQMINFTSSDSGFSSIATGNFGQNVEFFYYNGTVIPSWLENYTSTNALWWLKIAAIPSGSSETIYVGFAPTSTNLFNTVNDGEAPQLSCPNPSDTVSCSTYAEYDDGVNVFNNYWNFAGATLPSEFSEVNAGGTITVNNGLNISMSSNWGTYIISKTTFSDNEIFGSYFKSDNINTVSDAGASLIYSTSSNLGGSQYAATQYGDSGSYTNFVYNYANGVFPWNAIDQPYTYPTNTFYFYIIGITSSGTFGNGWINNVLINSANSNQLETSGYIALQQTQQTGIFQYVFVGEYPPNGVIPSVSFGSVQ